MDYVESPCFGSDVEWYALSASTPERGPLPEGFAEVHGVNKDLPLGP